MRRSGGERGRGLETRWIVYGDRRRPRDRPRELTVDVRRGVVIDGDHAAGMVAARTTLALGDVQIISVTSCSRRREDG